MVLFWRLLLAHFVADFPLQTDAVFVVKKEKPWGLLLHSTLFWLVAILLAKPFLKIGAVWGGLIILGLLHIVIDKSKLILVGKGHKDHLVYFLLDQALHVGSMSLLSFFLSRIPQVMAIAEGHTADLHLVKLAIAYVISVWASPLLSFYTQTALSPQKVEFKAHQPALWRMLGYVERWMLTTIVTWGGRLFFLIPLAFLPRIGLSFLAGERDVSPGEFALGSAIAILAGIWARFLG